MPVTSPPPRPIAAESPGAATPASRIPTWALAVGGLLGTLPLITRRVGDPDYWWHELTGRLIVQNRGLVRTELYTYTVPGTPWTDHEYGSQLVFYALTRVGGLLAVALFFAAVVFAGFGFLLARIRERVASPLVAGAALILGAGAGFAVWNPRSQMFDFLFLAIELWWVERFIERRGRAFYFLPLLVLLWANLHGGFVFSFAVVAILVVTLLLHWLRTRSAMHRRMLRDAVLVGIGCVVASLITPWGVGLFVYVLRTEFSSEQSSFIAEWQSPDFHMLNVLPFGIMLLAVLFGFIWRRPSLFEALMVLFSAVLALDAVRFTIIFVVLTTPILAWEWTPPWREVSAWLRERRLYPAPTPALRAAVLLAVSVFGAACIAFGATTLRGQAASTQANYPVAAADWLEAHPDIGTRMFNQYDWGGYLAYRFYPQTSRRVFIYGEAELMGDALLAEYVDVNQLYSNWEQVLDSYGVDYVVFGVNRPLDAALQASSQWQLVYSDNVADIFVRRSSLSAQHTG
jgi:hypothetical protein